MTNFSPCPQCESKFIYEDRALLVCPECAHEWRPMKGDEKNQGVASNVKDTNGNDLYEGDNATLIKDLKLKGSASVLKIGIKINRIADGDHNIDCRIDKVGEIMLKSAFVKKSNA